MEEKDEQNESAGSHRAQRPPMRKRAGLVIAGSVVAGLAVLGGVVAFSDDDPNLAPTVVAYEGSCTDEGASGSVVNNDNDHVTAVVEVSFFDADGAFLHKASATRPGIAPGESSDFELMFDETLSPEGAGGYDDCEISVPSVFRFNS